MGETAFDYQPHLQGRLLTMRPVRADDWEALYALAADPEVWALHPQHDRHRREVFEPYFGDGLESRGALVAIDRASGETAGWSRYSSEFAEPGEVEIGWTFLGWAYWGGAYNTDMKTIMLRHAFRFVDQVIFRIGETNLRSRRAAEKLGARLTDRRTEIITSGVPVPYLVYAIRRGDFHNA